MVDKAEFKTDIHYIYFRYIIQAGDRVLIVSHANTIRALVKAVDQVGCTSKA